MIEKTNMELLYGICVSSQTRAYIQTKIVRHAFNTYM